MQQLSQEQRFTFLTESVTNSLQPFTVDDIAGKSVALMNESKTIHTYMIVDPAGEHRSKVASLLTASFIPMLGIFPEEISKAVAEANEEPQLLLLDEISNELLGKILVEDSNAVLFLYSSLSLKALSEQLKPQLHLIVEESEQTGFMRYWDPRVFIVLSGLLDTLARKQAFMGNIHLVGFIDEEEPERFRVNYIGKTKEANESDTEDSLAVHFVNILPTKPINFFLTYETMAYVPLATPLIYSERDAGVFMKRRSQKQIREMARLLVIHPAAEKKGLTMDDELVDNINELVEKANQDYHINDVDALYQFVLASYVLGVGFEKADEALLVVLEDSLASGLKKQKLMENELYLYTTEKENNNG